MEDMLKLTQNQTHQPIKNKKCKIDPFGQMRSNNQRMQNVDKTISAFLPKHILTQLDCAFSDANDN